MILVEEQKSEEAIEFFDSYDTMMHYARQGVVKACREDAEVIETLAQIYLNTLTDNELAGWALRQLEAVEEENKNGDKEEEKEESKESTEEVEQKSDAPTTLSDEQKIDACKAALGTNPKIAGFLPAPTATSNKIELTPINKIRERAWQADNKFLYELVRYRDEAYLFVDTKFKCVFPIAIDPINHLAHVDISPLGLGAVLADMTLSRLVATGFFIFGRYGDTPNRAFDIRHSCDEVSVTIHYNKARTFKIERKTGHFYIPFYDFKLMLDEACGSKMNIPLINEHGTSYFALPSPVPPDDISA